MKKICKQLTLIALLVAGLQAWAGPLVKLEGTIDLSKKDNPDWRYGGTYQDQYLVKLTIHTIDHGPVQELREWHSSHSDMGGFWTYSCNTKVSFKGGAIQLELFDLITGVLITKVEQPMEVAAFFESETTENSNCYPHDYPSFEKEMVFLWPKLELSLGNGRSLVIKPFAFLDLNSLWGRGVVKKVDGKYRLISLSVRPGLEDTIYDTKLGELLALRYTFWEHYNSNRPMPWPGQSDASGYANDFHITSSELIE